MIKEMLSGKYAMRLNSRPVQKGDYVLYWMQQSQRAEDNLALEFAVAKANELKLPLLVGFGLTYTYPEANLRHYRFMLEGLQETQATLSRRGIQLLVQEGEPDAVALALGRKAALLVCDRGYLRHQKTWRNRVIKNASCAVFQVETDVIVPVETASNKAEWAARTLRPKLKRILASYLQPVPAEKLRLPAPNLLSASLSLKDLDQRLDTFQFHAAVAPVSKLFKGGTRQAKKKFRLFLQEKSALYEKNHNQPQTDTTSLMSPYLHFGQVSPLWLALQIQSAAHLSPGVREAYLEQLIIRRELAMNYAHFHPDYDNYNGLPAWARQTLSEHARDHRPMIYTLKQLEGADTHDPYWNAAMREMLFSGYMHNYMRMYWGKKILQWSPDPQTAFKHILYLNNKYFLDGRDPNSYTGTAWIFGLHDRPWKERAIFGKVRYMAASGLERKCDIRAYVAKVDNLVRSMKSDQKRSS